MDPIGNLLTSIRNAEAASHTALQVPYSKVSMAILGVLKDNKYIGTFSATEETKKKIVINLATKERPHVYKRLSTPGRRWYTTAKDIPMVLRGQGMVVVSTSKGMMTGKEANKKKLGGELICEVS